MPDGHDHPAPAGNEERQVAASGVDYAGVGLIMSAESPYRVEAVGALRDQFLTRAGHAAYSNPPISPGDAVISVDGICSSNLSVEQLNRMMQGEANTPVHIAFSPAQAPGEVYTVNLLRHKERTQYLDGTKLSRPGSDLQKIHGPPWPAKNNFNAQSCNKADSPHSARGERQSDFSGRQKAGQLWRTLEGECHKCEVVLEGSSMTIHPWNTKRTAEVSDEHLVAPASFSSKCSSTFTTSTESALKITLSFAEDIVPLTLDPKLWTDWVYSLHSDLCSSTGEEENRFDIISTEINDVVSVDVLIRPILPDSQSTRTVYEVAHEIVSQVGNFRSPIRYAIPSLFQIDFSHAKTSSCEDGHDKDRGGIGIAMDEDKIECDINNQKTNESQLSESSGRYDIIETSPSLIPTTACDSNADADEMSRVEPDTRKNSPCSELVGSTSDSSFCSMSASFVCDRSKPMDTEVIADDNLYSLPPAWRVLIANVHAVRDRRLKKTILAHWLVSVIRESCADINAWC